MHELSRGAYDVKDDYMYNMYTICIQYGFNMGSIDFKKDKNCKIFRCIAFRNVSNIIVYNTLLRVRKSHLYAMSYSYVFSQRRRDHPYSKTRSFSWEFFIIMRLERL